MSIKIQQTKYEPIPEGIYPGMIVGIEKDPNNQYGPQLKIRFMLEDVPGYDNGKEMSTWCSAKFSPKSKLYRWTNSILGRIREGYDFDSDDVLNKKVLVSVGRKIGSDGQEYDRIEDVKPLRAPVKKSAAEIDAELATVDAAVPT